MKDRTADRFHWNWLTPWWVVAVAWGNVRGCHYWTLPALRLFRRLYIGR